MLPTGYMIKHSLEYLKLYSDWYQSILLLPYNQLSILHNEA